MIEIEAAMASIFLSHILIIFPVSLFLFLYYTISSKKRAKKTPYWPILPSLLLNFHRFHDKLTEILEENNGTVLSKRLTADKHVLCTSDPANVHHIMSTNFSNYVKGSEWRKRFDIFGHGIFNSDSDEWAYHRKFVRGFFSNQSTFQFMRKILQDSVENELIPVLEYVAEQADVVDLQLMFRRLTFYIAANIAGCSCNKFPDFVDRDSFTKALDETFEAIFLRHFLPESLWKLQRRLGFGKEKKLSKAWEIFDTSFAKYMSIKKNQLSSSNEEDLSLLKVYMSEHEEMSYSLMRDNIIAFILAAGDTVTSALSWFFWLLSQNPDVETKIRQELERIDGNQTHLIGEFDLTNNKMVYLQAALMETLRLYPPVPYQSRSPVQDDILPSGHKIKAGETRISICTYAMGRMESVWGEDSKEFKPERWITETGNIRVEPAHKMFAFNAGPRICLGKDMSLIIMKTFVATIIRNYRVEVVERQSVEAKASIILQIKNGLMVRIRKIKPSHS